MEKAVSVRPYLKTHEILTEIHHKSNRSLKVCPVVEDEMVEEIMDDKEEQSEESRAVRVGQKKKTVTPTPAEREEHERNTHTHPTEVGADIVPLHGQAILLIEAESSHRRR